MASIIAAAAPLAAAADRDGAVLGAIAAAAASSASLVLLPELAPIPWVVGQAPPAVAGRALALDAPLVLRVREAASRHRIAVALPLPLRHEGVVFNALLLIDDGGGLVEAREATGRTWPFAAKLHLPPARDGFGEGDHFVPGPAPVLHRWRGFGLGSLICFDRRFPECWRAAARLGAEIVLVPVGGPGGDAPGLFLAELRAGAKANGVAVIAACRAGTESVGGMTVMHEGESCIISPEGDVLAHTHDAAAVNAPLTAVAIAEARARRPFLSLLRDDVAVAARGDARR